MAPPYKAANHIATHPTETDHSDLHDCSPRSEFEFSLVQGLPNCHV